MLIRSRSQAWPARDSIYGAADLRRGGPRRNVVVDGRHKCLPTSKDGVEARLSAAVEIRASDGNVNIASQPLSSRRPSPVSLPPPPRAAKPGDGQVARLTRVLPMLGDAASFILLVSRLLFGLCPQDCRGFRAALGGGEGQRGSEGGARARARRIRGKGILGEGVKSRGTQKLSTGPGWMLYDEGRLAASTGSVIAVAAGDDDSPAGWHSRCLMLTPCLRKAVRRRRCGRSRVDLGADWCLACERGPECVSAWGSERGGGRQLEGALHSRGRAG